ncbi:MAG: hypothetical protein NC203_00540 [Firmicutes bacterium]|nr:hypothetical protein [[Eubacterium] siraeum]MCM1486827.1 hypothetical protein [Bacillota bacterium]
MDIHSQIIEVIATTYNKGSGTAEDPVRRTTSYFNLKGEFLFERDEYDVAIEQDKMLRERYGDI